MDNIREIFARNLRENRRKRGLTQAQLAEKAKVSTHYIALIELARNIPKVETIEKLANALNVEVYELFIAPHYHGMEMKNYHEAIVSNLKDIVKESVNEAFEQEHIRQKQRK